MLSKLVSLTTHLGLDEKNPALVDIDVFESIVTPGKLLLLTGWATPEAGAAWTPSDFGGATVRHRRMRNIRNYGMFERDEAAQYYPPAVHHG